MTTRDRAPAGAPCWADLWTSDVEGSRSFYSDLFGWEAQAPSPEFGGYFMFTRDGAPVAGGMGDMGDMKANDSWKIYLATDDIEQTLVAVTANGGEAVFPPMPVADLGTQSVITDPVGAPVGLWQPGTFGGFPVLGEIGAPCWFELRTPDFARSLEFYRAVFGWETDVMSDTDEFRYSVVRDPSSEGQLGGVHDASGFLPAGTPASWTIVWQVADADETVARAGELGGRTVREAQDSPYGRLAALTDPSGAEFTVMARP